MKDYEADISVNVRPFYTLVGDSLDQPFADRSASLSLHVRVEDRGLETSAFAIAEALEAAAFKVREMVGTADGSATLLREAERS